MLSKKACAWQLILIILLPLMVSGCASFSMGYERFYQGGQKPLAEVAIIIPISDSWGYATSSWINFIDKKEAKKDIRMGITFPSVREVDPGPHVICTSYQRITSSRRSSRSVGCSEMTLNANPGQVYFVYPRINTHNSTWQPAYWNITADLHAPELKGVVAAVDKTLAQKRGGHPVSITSLATRQAPSPLIGFGEKHTSNLRKWLKNDITVSYKFDRYEPNIIAEADDGIEYHLTIDPTTGKVSDVLGRNVDVARGFYPAFQPLNSKLAYSYNENRKTQPVWQEQADGSFVRIKK